MTPAYRRLGHYAAEEPPLDPPDSEPVPRGRPEPVDEIPDDMEDAS